MYLEIIRVLVRHFSKLFTPVYEECEVFFKSESKSREQAVGLLKKIFGPFSSIIFERSFFKNRHDDKEGGKFPDGGFRHRF